MIQVRKELGFLKQQYQAFDDGIPSLVHQVAIGRVVRAKHVPDPIFSPVADRQLGALEVLLSSLEQWWNGPEILAIDFDGPAKPNHNTTEDASW